MSWRAGAELFWEIWPRLEAALPDADDRLDFGRELLALFLRNDVDPCQLRGGDPKVDRLMDELDAEIG